MKLVTNGNHWKSLARLGLEVHTSVEFSIYLGSCFHRDQDCFCDFGSDGTSRSANHFATGRWEFQHYILGDGCRPCTLCVVFVEIPQLGSGLDYVCLFDCGNRFCLVVIPRRSGGQTSQSFHENIRLFGVGPCILAELLGNCLVCVVTWKAL